MHPRLPLFSVACALAHFANVSAQDGQPLKPDHAGFSNIVQPFLKEHCVSCHGPEKQKGKLRLDTLANDFGDPSAVTKWKEVVNSVNAHEMPPEDEKQPTPEAAAKFAAWLDGELARGEMAKRSTRVVLRRMNRAEYDNTIRDLVGVDFHAVGEISRRSAGGRLRQHRPGAHDVADAGGAVLRDGAADPRPRAGRGRAAAGASSGASSRRKTRLGGTATG